MKLQINQQALNDSNLTLEEFMTLVLYYCNPEGIDTTIKSLENKGMLNSRKYQTPPKNGYIVTKAGVDAINNVNIESNPEISNVSMNERLKNLAVKLKEIYPKGKNKGGYYWAEGTSIITRRLKTFMKDYDDGFTDEQIINATRRYVKDKTGTPYMKTLRYFIFRKRTFQGDTEPSSDLLTYIENAGEINETRENWTNTLV